LEFVPQRDNAGIVQTGYGQLFISDYARGSIARLTMVPSGNIGHPNTVMIPSDRGKDAIIFLTFPNLSSPVGLAYSNELGKVYAACRGNGIVIEFTPDGEMTAMFDTGFGAASLSGLAVGDMGSGDVVFLSHTGGERVDTSSGNQGSIFYFDPNP
jgi:hypothetical protein